MGRHDNRGCVKAIRGLVIAFDQLPRSSVDAHMTQKLAKALPTARRCLSFVYDDGERLDLESLIMGILMLTETIQEKGIHPRPGDHDNGCILHMPTKTSLGIVRNNDGHQIFFRQEDMSPDIDQNRTTIGAKVQFLVTGEGNAQRAVNISV